MRAPSGRRMQAAGRAGDPIGDADWEAGVSAADADWRPA
jgi:hypothetical protein